MNKSVGEKLGAWLRARRSQAGLSQIQAAELLRMQQSKESALERGTRWRAGEIVHVAEGFNVTPGQLIDEALGLKVATLDEYDARLLDVLRAGGRRLAILYLVDNPDPREPQGD